MGYFLPWPFPSLFFLPCFVLPEPLVETFGRVVPAGSTGWLGGSNPSIPSHQHRRRGHAEPEILQVTLPLSISLGCEVPRCLPAASPHRAPRLRARPWRCAPRRDGAGSWRGGGAELPPPCLCAASRVSPAGSLALSARLSARFSMSNDINVPPGLSPRCAANRAALGLSSCSPVSALHHSNPVHLFGSSAPPDASSRRCECPEGEAGGAGADVGAGSPVSHVPVSPPRGQAGQVAVGVC